MEYLFIFRNRDTLELRHAIGSTRNAAAQALGWEVYYGDDLPAPWGMWEAWQGDECLWHYTEAGDCMAGPRRT